VSGASSDVVGLPLSSLAGAYPQASLRLRVGSVAVLSAAIGQPEAEFLNFVTGQYQEDADSNAAYARLVFERARERLGSRFRLERSDAPLTVLMGNQAIAMGAYARTGHVLRISDDSLAIHPALLCCKCRSWGVVAVYSERQWFLRSIVGLMVQMWS